MTTLRNSILISIDNEIGRSVPSFLPLDLDDELTLNWVTIRVGALQRMGILDIDVAIMKASRKRQGEFTDGFLGRASKALDGPIVDNIAIKHVRLEPNDIFTRERVTSALIGAQDTWSSLCHPNICPIWSLTSCGKPIPAVAMPWYRNGNIIEYMLNATVNKLDIVKQVASAIVYIHSVGEVHGNLTPMNILIMDDGNACLSDIGLNTCLRNAKYNCDVPVPSSWMFKAPEELKAEGSPSSFRPTEAMDVYAFAGTVYSIFTSRLPFCSRLYGRGIKEIISRGHNLERPVEIGVPLWELLSRCWSFASEDRPSMVAVEAALEGI